MNRQTSIGVVFKDRWFLAERAVVTTRRRRTTTTTTTVERASVGEVRRDVSRASAGVRARVMTRLDARETRRLEGPNQRGTDDAWIDEFGLPANAARERPAADDE